MPYIGVPPADRTSGARVRDEFTGDGTQICFQLSQEVPGSFESNVIAVVENVIQEPVIAYSIVNTVTLTLTSISGTFVKNETVTGGTSSATGTVVQVNLNNIVIRVSSGTFQTAEGITGGGSSATATIVTTDTNVGRGLLFSSIPTSGSSIYVLHQNAATYQVKPAAGSVTPETLSENLRTFTVDKFTSTSGQTQFTLSTTPVSVKSILVFVDGVMQTETTHYTLSGAVVTMDSGLATGQQVTVVHLGFSTVSRTAFADGVVTTNMIADGAITSAKIATGGVATIDMADGSVTSLKIANGGIATEDIADSAITTAKIAAGAVVTADLADGAVTTAKITDANVTAAKLASGAAVSNIGYTPVNKAGDTMTDNLDISGTNKRFRVIDGSKSMSFGQWDGTNNRLESSGAPFLIAHYGATDITFQNQTSGGYFKMDSTGRVTKPAQPAFRVGFSSGSDASTTSSSPVPFDAKSFDTGNNFNTSTNRFVAPVAGTYLFHANLYFTRSAGDFTGGIGFMVNGSQVITTAGDGARSDANLGGDAGETTIISLNNTIILNLSANDFVQVFGINYSGAPAQFRYYRGTSFFQGYLLG